MILLLINLFSCNRFLQISCLGVEACVEGDPARFALTSRGADGNTVRFVLHSSSPDICKAWVSDVSQILETQRNFLNGEIMLTTYKRFPMYKAAWKHLFKFVLNTPKCSLKMIWFVMCYVALQSPIEYQRRESKSNSLGRSMKPPLSAIAGLRPHSSASIDRHKLPCLHSCNTSLPSIYLPSQVPTNSHAQPEVRDFIHMMPCVYVIRFCILG